MISGKSPDNPWRHVLSSMFVNHYAYVIAERISPQKHKYTLLPRYLCSVVATSIHRSIKALIICCLSARKPWQIPPPKLPTRMIYIWQVPHAIHVQEQDNMGEIGMQDSSRAECSNNLGMKCPHPRISNY